MKIIHLITGLKPAGAENLLFRLALGSEQVGLHPVVVSLSSGGALAATMRSSGIRVYELDGQKNIGRACVELLQILKKERADVLHCWMYHANFLSVLVRLFAPRLRVFWSVHNLSPSDPALSRKTMFIARLCGFLSHFVPRKVIFVSKVCSAAHVASGYSGSRALVIENGVDLKFFQRDMVGGSLVRKKLGVGRGSIVIGCVARWDVVKGHALLLRAVSELSEHYPLEVMLVGEGMVSGNKSLIGLLSEFSDQLKVHFCGGQQNLNGYYSAMDVHVLPSFKEAFGLTTAEAMACEVISVASRTGIVEQLIEDPNLIFEVGDIESLKKSINSAVNLFRTNEHAGEVQRSIISSKFSLDRALTSYKACWEK